MTENANTKRLLKQKETQGLPRSCELNNHIVSFAVY